jgi:nitrogen fixation/metabolism regulation signal transduction histidine kinase
VEKLKNFVIITGLLVTGLVILLAAMFSHRITEPIRRLIGYTVELSKGNLDARVQIHTRDEIAVLADSFNHMAADLKESNRKLIEAEKNAAWSEMARQVAHEIKNPLTPIMLSAQQLERAHKDRHPDFDALLQESVKTIVGQCEDLRKIASDFASYSRFNTSNQTEEALAPVVRKAVELYQSNLAEGMRVEADLRIDDEVLIRMNKDRFHRLLLNLFNNAIEATDGHGLLKVIARILPGRSRVEVLVQDDGKGISEESRLRLFEPYFSTRTGGTGLGLAISKRIVEESGGTIRFESVVGKGTTFTMTFPLASPRSES